MKKCCNFDCRQGRDCPMAEFETDSLLVNILCCCVSVFLISAPFAAWYMGIV